MSELLNEISKIGIVPVVVLEDADKAVGVAKALQKGGINCAEVTFRTAAAEESIKNIAQLCSATGCNNNRKTDVQCTSVFCFAFTRR